VVRTTPSLRKIVQMGSEKLKSQSKRQNVSGKIPRIIRFHSNWIV
jgi:hypothetical protein